LKNEFCRIKKHNRRLIRKPSRDRLSHFRNCLRKPGRTGCWSSSTLRCRCRPLLFLGRSDLDLRNLWTSGSFI